MTSNSKFEGTEDVRGASRPPVRAECHRYGFWLNVIIGHEPGWKMALRASAFSAGVFGLGFVIAIAGNAGSDYLGSVEAYLIGLGMLLITFGYGWISWTFLSLWGQIRSAFAVSDDAYSVVVEAGLSRIYNDRLILIEFVIALVGILFLQGLIIRGMIPLPRIPAAIIAVEAFAPVDLIWVWMTYNDLINHVIGAVVLLLLVTGIHMTITGLWLIYRISQLPVEAPRTAADKLEPVWNFSIFAATVCFLGVVFLVLVYWSFIDYMLQDGPGVASGVWVIGTIVVIMLAGIGFVLIPQISIHYTLIARKRQRLRELEDELDSLLESMRVGELEPEEASLALEIHDRQRERVDNARTWLYDGKGILQLVASGLAAGVTLVPEALRVFGEVL